MQTAHKHTNQKKLIALSSEMVYVPPNDLVETEKP